MRKFRTLATALFIAMLVIVFTFMSPAILPMNADVALAQQSALNPSAATDPSDLGFLAGTYRGDGYSAQGKRLDKQITRYIKPDGSYESHGYIMVVGKITRDQDRKIWYQDSVSSGTVEVIQKKGAVFGLRFWRDKDNNLMAADLDKTN